MELRIRLNGTKVNPWLKLGLTQNPFPQIARAELMVLMDQLNHLGAEPITGPDDIRARLKGWSPEFIELCVEKFRPGEMVRFTISFPNE